MAGIGLIVVVLAIGLASGQNTLNDLMTLKLLDVDIPEASYQNILGGRGRGGFRGLLSGQQNNLLGGIGGQQNNLGLFGNAGQQQLNLGQQQLNLGQQQQFNLGQQQQQLNLGHQQQLGVGGGLNLGQGLNMGNIGQQLPSANLGLSGMNSFGQATPLNTANQGLNNLNSNVGFGQAAIGQQSLLGNNRQGLINQQSGLQGLSNMAGLAGVNRGIGQTNGLRGGNQLQRLGRVGSAGARALGGARRTLAGGQRLGNRV